MSIINFYHNLVSKLNSVNVLSSLAIRLYLAPIFIIAGYSKLGFSEPGVTGLDMFFATESIVSWFGNNDWGLGLPLPSLLANCAAWVEFLGGWLLLLGLMTRLISIPLIFTMIVAATTVHWQNGWFVITPTSAETSPAQVLTWLGFEQAKESLENSQQTAVRLERMRAILDENGNTEWLYEKGNIVVLNNGVEFSITYLILLLALFNLGAGRYVSVDYYLHQYWLNSRNVLP